MSTSDKIVDFIGDLLTGLLPKPAEAILKPVVKPLGEGVKGWLKEPATRAALQEAAEKAESDFREAAREKFGNDDLTQAVASFPIHNAELFQAALQSLPEHLDETILTEHVSGQIERYWSGKFTKEEISAGTALYLDCLRQQLLHVEGFEEIVTRLAVLRIDRRTGKIEESNEKILEIVTQLLDLFTSLSERQAVSTAAPRLHQVPAPPPDFTGREEDIRKILADFESGRGAAISGLTGLGGIGKTALGLEVASRLNKRYPDAQIFLDLRGTTTPLSAAEVMRHVIPSFEPEANLKDLDEAGLRAAYQNVLQGRKALLFFDNARSEKQVTPLLPPSTCGMLVTSRWVFPVSGLAAHKVGVLEPGEAREYLLKLCARIGEQAAALAEACGRLPLALKIAGSFLQVNADRRVGDYLKQLKDRLAALKKAYQEAEMGSDPDIEAAFDLSYEQLDEEDRKALRALGVLQAPFTGHAAQMVWGMGEEETKPVLSRLVRYSLVDYVETTGRYELHDLLREYALGKMEKEEEQAARLAHAKYYKDLLAAADYLFLQGGEHILEGLRLFDLEWPHIQAGQAWTAGSAEGNEGAASLCASYPLAGANCLSLRLHARRRIEWLEAAVKAARKTGDRRREGNALCILGLAYFDLGNARKAIDFYEDYLNITRELIDRQGEGIALGNLGSAYYRLGEARKAIEFYEQALEIGREIGDRRGEGNALGNLGLAYAALGEARKAIEFYEKGLVIDREIGDRRGEGADLGNLGSAYADLGEVRKAIEFYEQKLVIAREIGDRRGEGNALGNLGSEFLKLGDAHKAIEFNERHLAITREIGDRWGEGVGLHNLGESLFALGQRSEGVSSVKRALAIFEELEAPNAEESRNKLKEWGAEEG